MRNSTGSPLFPDFKSDLSRVARSTTAGQRNEDPGYEGVIRYINVQYFNLAHAHKPKLGLSV